jgi:hypothetical protein
MADPAAEALGTIRGRPRALRVGHWHEVVLGLVDRLLDLSDPLRGRVRRLREWEEDAHKNKDHGDPPRVASDMIARQLLSGKWQRK